ncbi:GAF domain-containing protein [Streptomyces longispororuber]|uniref:GAF domain-containing protein n=1 Tax=Streptomyces longispororuber TaxID=68230 RepID=A0A919ABG1_9ACTN|nr:ANTAR domain-containing protein [Streptomyces longispororuber]GHE93497.1 GAF domain-containing protein [Streptomyces longispororuber]
MGSTVRDLLGRLSGRADDTRRKAWAHACAEALGLGGVAVTVNEELVWFSDTTSERLEDLQFTLGQGPGLGLDDPVEMRQIPDLGELLARQWPQFAPEAVKLGVAALFVWPVRLGAVPVGTLTGYRRTTGPLTARQVSEGWLVADVLAEHVLANWPAEPDANGPGHAGTVDLHRAEVHQATGVLSVRLNIPLAEALDRLRARAYASGRSLTDTAHDILRQELPHDDH